MQAKQRLLEEAEGLQARLEEQQRTCQSMKEEVGTRRLLSRRRSRGAASSCW